MAAVPEQPVPLAAQPPTARRRGPATTPRLRLMAWLLGAMVPLLLMGPAAPALAALNTNSYDGNIYALYAGNGSLVPPRSTLEQALAAHRAAVVVYYLDDAAASKRFAPAVSELQRLWGNSIELIPLAADPLQNRPDLGPGDPAHYWRGRLPQVVVFSPDGEVLLDAEGQVELPAINAAVSEATGITIPEEFSRSTLMSINELNAEVVNQ